MDNEVKEQKKFNLKFWIPMGIGIFSIVMSILTIVLIYVNTPNYLLVKNNYDCYHNPENKELETKDFCYMSTETSDASFFTINNDNFVIHLSALANNNPDFKTGDYMIDCSFYLKCEFPDFEKYNVSARYITKLDSEELSTLNVAKVNDKTIKEGFKFKDGNNDFSVILPSNQITYNEVDYNIEISEIRVMFYSLKK